MKLRIAMALTALAAPLASWAAQTAGPPVPQRLLPRARAAEPCENRPQAGEEIVVCGEQESDERHRLPLVRDRRFDPAGDVDSVSRERNRLLGTNAGGTLGSCNNVGPNGMTGCLNQGVWQRREQKGR